MANEVFLVEGVILSSDCSVKKIKIINLKQTTETYSYLDVEC